MALLEFIGLGTPSDNLLGALGFSLATEDFTGDLDSVFGNGFMRVSPTANNNPVGAYGMLEVFGTSPISAVSTRGYIQRIRNYTGGPMYERLYADSGWSNWSLNYDHNLLTNTTELSSLASALGVFKTHTWGTWLTDLTGSIPNGFYSFESSTTNGIPEGFTGVGVMVVFSQSKDGSGTYGMRFAYGLNNGVLYFQSKWDGAWNAAWKTISLS